MKSEVLLALCKDFTPKVAIHVFLFFVFWCGSKRDVWFGICLDSFILCWINGCCRSWSKTVTFGWVLEKEETETRIALWISGQRTNKSPAYLCGRNWSPEAAVPFFKMAHAAASIKKVREAEIDEREKEKEKERKRQRKISRENRKRKVWANIPHHLFPFSPGTGVLCNAGSCSFLLSTSSFPFAP